MATQLRIYGAYKVDAFGERVYEVRLKDGDSQVDTLVYPCVGTRVETPAGYPKNAEGARQYAKDTWL